MIGRLFEMHDKKNLSYERLSDEPVCAVARPDHPMLGDGALTLQEIQQAAWVVPADG